MIVKMNPNVGVARQVINAGEIRAKAADVITLCANKCPNLKSYVARYFIKLFGEDAIIPESFEDALKLLKARGFANSELASFLKRYVGKEEYTLENCYEDFMLTGANYASYTQVALRDAEFDYYTQMLNSGRPKSDIVDVYKNLQVDLNSLSKTPEGLNLFSRIKEQHKSTGLKRMAIATGLSEGSNNIFPCSTNKKIKKAMYKLYKAVNKNFNKNS